MTTDQVFSQRGVDPRDGLSSSRSTKIVSKKSFCVSSLFPVVRKEKEKTTEIYITSTFSEVSEIWIYTYLLSDFPFFFFVDELNILQGQILALRTTTVPAKS